MEHIVVPSKTVDELVAKEDLCAACIEDIVKGLPDTLESIASEFNAGIG